MKAVAFNGLTRRRQLAAMVAGSGAVLAACVPGADSGAGGQRGPLSGDMEFWFHWAANTAGYYEAMQRSAAWFRAENPGVQLTANQVTGSAQQEKLTILAASGSRPPDVMTTSSVTVGLAAAKLLRPIDDLLRTSKIKRSQFLDSAWDGSAWRGQTYGVLTVAFELPFCLAWNKTLFTQRGLDPEKPPRTNLDLFELGAKITQPDKQDGLALLGFHPLYGSGSNWSTWLMRHGIPAKEVWDPKTPEKVRINQPAIEQIFTDNLNYLKRLDLGRIDVWRKAWPGDNGFANSANAMMIRGSPYPGLLSAANPALLPYIGYGWIPTQKSERVQGFNPWNLTIPAGAKRADLAMTFIEFWTTFRVQDMMRELTGSFGAIKEYIDKADLRQQPPGVSTIFGMLKQVERLEPNGVVMPLTVPFGTAMTAAWDSVVASKATPRQALEETQKNVQGQLDEVIQKGR